MVWFFDFITNPFLITGISSWLIAQTAKTWIHAIANRKLDIRRFFGDGGMPSGHSATAASLAAMSACMYGAGSFPFAISVIFAVIVCHDAMGVRRETEKQTVVLNKMAQAFGASAAKDIQKIKLKEAVGHTPAQVLAGIAVGVADAFVLYYFII